MRFSVVLALAAVASATLLPRQALPPSCALNCLSSADTGSCGADNACLCKDQNFVSSTTACITKACTGADLEAALAGARALCEAAGVTLTDSSTSPPNSTPTDTSTSDTKTTPSPSDNNPPPTNTPGAASANGANAMLALAAVGAAVFAL